jgi:hypothetical protein
MRPVNMLNQRCGRWIVKSREEGSGRPRIYWNCVCDCGNSGVVSTSQLRSGKSQSCGCLNKEIVSAQRLIDLTGKIFGRWKVISKFASRRPGNTLWTCVCECGKVSQVDGWCLRNNGSKSCKGCSSRSDIVGRRFGRWVVKKWVGEKKWLCVCDCGSQREVSTCSLKNGRSQSCGCRNREKVRIRPFEALYNRFCATAKAAEREVELTYEEFVEFTKSVKCYYCWSLIRWTMYGVTRNGAAYNLDRMDNTQGYRTDNLVVCCKKCNFGKSSEYTHDEWYGMTAYFRAQKVSQTALTVGHKPYTVVNERETFCQPSASRE